MPGEGEIAYRPLGAEDLGQVLAIERDSFPAPWSESLFRQEIEFPASHFIVMLIDGKLVGYGGFWVVSDEAHITNLAIERDSREKGLGTRFLRKMLDDALKMDLKRATLEVRESNVVARRLYEKFGFLAVAVRKHYYSDTNENAIIMWKENLTAKGSDNAIQEP